MFYVATTADSRIKRGAILRKSLERWSTVLFGKKVNNYNLPTHPVYSKIFELMRDTKAPVLSETFDVSNILGEGALLEHEDDLLLHPETIFLQPFDSFDKQKRVVVGTIYHGPAMGSLLQQACSRGRRSNDLHSVRKDTCGGGFSYRVEGPVATFMHEPRYDFLAHVVPFGLTIDFSQADDDAEDDHCECSLHIYPTVEFEECATVLVQ